MCALEVWLEVEPRPESPSEGPGGVARVKSHPESCSDWLLQLYSCMASEIPEGTSLLTNVNLAVTLDYQDRTRGLVSLH